MVHPRRSDIRLYKDANVLEMDESMGLELIAELEEKGREEKRDEEKATAEELEIVELVKTLREDGWSVEEIAETVANNLDRGPKRFEEVEWSSNDEQEVEILRVRGGAGSDDENRDKEKPEEKSEKKDEQEETGNTSNNVEN